MPFLLKQRLLGKGYVTNSISNLSSWKDLVSKLEELSISASTVRSQDPFRMTKEEIDNISLIPLLAYILEIRPKAGKRFRRDYTASDKLVKVKSLIFIGGTRLPPMRCGLPKASRLLSMMTGLSLKRKFFTGCLILPFSM